MTTVNLKGNPVELSGTPPQVGDKVPDFTLTKNDFSRVSLSESDGKIRLISVVPSIDTGICSLQTKRFNQEIDNLPDSVVAYTISVDTPFAQKRWCAAEGVEKMTMLSDYRDGQFGKDWGLYVAEPLGVLARSVFVLDESGTVVYFELVPEIGQEPNYEPALAKAKELAGA